ncbi:MAG: signal peptidase I [Desulfobacteraceae bacterium]|nr:signal peptidase I [Desulfobacteraceae bacterium]
MHKPPKSARRENIEAVIIAVILAILIRTFVVQAFKIPSSSMENTLLVGDHILVNKFIFGVKVPFTGKTIIPGRDPAYGDIIVFRYPKDPSKDYIKRVIGMAGDMVEIRNKSVYINDELVDSGFAEFKDPTYYPRPEKRDNYGPVKIPGDSLFVMGDNRDNSSDSRFWGFVEKESVKGKAFIIYWSWDSEHFSWSGIHSGVRWNRLAKVLE